MDKFLVPMGAKADPTKQWNYKYLVASMKTVNEPKYQERGRMMRAGRALSRKPVTVGRQDEPSSDSKFESLTTPW